MFSCSCQPAGQELNAGEEEPCLGAGDGRFEVLGQAPVAVEPGQSTFGREDSVEPPYRTFRVRRATERHFERVVDEDFDGLNSYVVPGANTDLSGGGFFDRVPIEWA